MTTAIFRGMPNVGNSHARFEEGKDASAKRKRGSQLYRTNLTALHVLALSVLGMSAVAHAALKVETNGTEVVVSVSEGRETLKAPFFAEDVSTVYYTTGALDYLPIQPSTYTGGTKIGGVRLYFTSPAAFGTGPIRLGYGLAVGSEANLVVEKTSVTLTNQVVFFGRNCRVLANPANPSDSVTLKSIGVDGSDVIRTACIGRTFGGTSSAVLSLTESTTGPVDGIVMSGDLHLTLDGGVVKVREHAQPIFFDRSDADCTADIAVTRNGFAVDVPEDTETTLTSEYVFDVIDEYVVRETVSPDNPSFESGDFTGWKLTETATTEDCSVRKNGSSAFDGNGMWPTSEGDYFAVVRHDTRLEPTSALNLPAAGMWRVRFLRGCRPNSTTYSVGVKTTVRIDGEVIQEYPALTSTELHEFKEFVSVPVELAAGEHTLAIENGPGGNSTSFNFDSIRFERVIKLQSVGPVSKSGSGRLTLDGWRQSLVPFEANGGVLAFCGGTFTNTALTVAAGATAELAFSTFNGASSVTVPSGGTVRLSDVGGNLVLNGSFEYDGAAPYSERRNGTGWTCVNELSLARTDAPYGCLHNNSDTLASHFAQTAYGVESFILREGVSIEQNVTCPSDGTYVISFVQTCRNGSYASGSSRIPTSVIVDGQTVYTTPRFDNVYPFTRFSAEVELTAGVHAIKLFAGETDRALEPGNMVLVDDVRVCRKQSSADFGDGELRLSSGATLALDNAQPVSVRNLFVDGVRIDGGRTALQNAGVTVTGSGRIKAGEGLGFILSIR